VKQCNKGWNYGVQRSISNTKSWLCLNTEEVETKHHKFEPLENNDSEWRRREKVKVEDCLWQMGEWGTRKARGDLGYMLFGRGERKLKWEGESCMITHDGICERGK